MSRHVTEVLGARVRAGAGRGVQELPGGHDRFDAAIRRSVEVRSAGTSAGQVDHAVGDAWRAIRLIDNADQLPGGCVPALDNRGNRVDPRDVRRATAAVRNGAVGIDARCSPCPGLFALRTPRVVDEPQLSIDQLPLRHRRQCEEITDREETRRERCQRCGLAVGMIVSERVHVRTTRAHRICACGHDVLPFESVPEKFPTDEEVSYVQS